MRNSEFRPTSRETGDGIPPNKFGCTFILALSTNKITVRIAPTVFNFIIVLLAVRHYFNYSPQKRETKNFTDLAAAHFRSPEVLPAIPNFAFRIILRCFLPDLLGIFYRWCLNCFWSPDASCRRGTYFCRL